MVLDVAGYLRGKERSASPAMAAKWALLAELHSKRLWHQLTVEILAFAQEPGLQVNNLLIELYDNFVKEFEHRINKLSYMELCVLIVAQYDKPLEAYSFLDNCEKHVKGDLVAFSLCKITRGQIKFEKEHDLSAVKTILNEVDDLFRQIDGISVAHGRFYKLQSKYYLDQGNLTEYYRSAIKYLGCTPLKDMPLSEQREHAKNLAISSLVADGMYNFGELLAHPILDSIKRTPDDWLLQLVTAFNAGNVTEYERLKPKWIKNKQLAANELKLRTKIILLAIMETTFEKSANQRQLTFEDIAKVTKVPIDQVDLYVMKAISQGLVAGKIDSVGRKVFMTWVQPRVLAPGQIATMISRLNDWQEDLGIAKDMMKRNTVEIFED